MNPGDKRALHANCFDGKRPRSSMQVYADLRQLIRLREDSGYEREQHIIESSIRPVVAEEIDRTLSRMFGPVNQEREPLKRITEVSARKLRLRFKTNPAAASFTGNILVDEDGNTICVELIDMVTNRPVTTGPESVTKLEVVPLMGDFDNPEEQDWSSNEFEAHVVKAREEKGPLLDGDLEVHLQEGMGALERICFTDNSSFTRSKKFRLGVRVARDNVHGLMSVREGKSQAFTVKESRGKGYMKHDTPSPTDDVWRLRHIRKDGAYHKKLMEKGIKTVGDFVFCLEKNPQILKDVLSTMCKKDFQDTIHNSKQCVNEAQDCAYVGLGMVAGDVDKVRNDGLVYKSAYKHCDMDEITEVAVENAAGLSMIGTVNGSLENDKIDAATMLQAAPDGSWSVERVTGFEHNITQLDQYKDVDAEQESTSQGQSSGFDVADLSNDLRKQLEGLNSSIVVEEVESQVWGVVSEEVFGEAQEANPAASAWWLRIRSAVRCALFLHRVRLARPLELM